MHSFYSHYFSLFHYIIVNDLDRSDNVNADNLVRVPSEKSGAIGRPSQTGAVRSAGMAMLFITAEFLGSQGVNNNLGFQVPDLDALISGSAQPVSVGGEDKRVDDFTSIKGVKALAFVQVPKHGSSVLSSGSTERAIGGNTDSVEVSGVSNEVVAELAVG